MQNCSGFQNINAPFSNVTQVFSCGFSIFPLFCYSKSSGHFAAKEGAVNVIHDASTLSITVADLAEVKQTVKFSIIVISITTPGCLELL